MFERFTDRAQAGSGPDLGLGEEVPAARRRTSSSHKAILGTAYELATGQRLAPGDFEGGKDGAVKVLERLGFTVQPLAHSAS